MQIRKGKRYRRYIQSRQWRGIRQRVLERDNHTCQRCGENGRPGNELDVHHLSYARLYNEELSDLLTLCRGCHGDIHSSIERLENLGADLKRGEKGVNDALEEIFG